MDEALAKEEMSYEDAEASRAAGKKEWMISSLLNEMNVLTTVWAQMEENGFEARHTVNALESLCKEFISLGEKE